jgi:hypothetical protein
MSISVDNNVKNQKTTPALYSDLYANIPAFGQTGRLFFATDTNTIYRDTGSAWVVFIVNATVPSGLTPIGAAYTLVGVNGTGTALEYKTIGGTSPVVVTSAANSILISMSLANTTTSGYLSSTDWNTFNGKGNGTVTSVAAITLGTTGTDLSSTVANGTTTPVITLNVPTASATNRGAVSSADWTTFNAKIGGSGTTNTIPKFTASGTIGDSTITDSGTLIFLGANTYTTSRIGIGSSPASTASNLHMDKSILGAITSYGIYNAGSVAATVTNAATYYYAKYTLAASTAISAIYNYQSIEGTFGSGASSGFCYGYYAGTMTLGTYNYGFYSDVNSGTNRWGFYQNGSASNYLQTLFVGNNADNNTGSKLQVTGNISFQNVFNRKTASYTLVLADQNDIIEMNVATANNLTVPLNSTVAFPIGTEIAITQYGAGKTTIVATGGVTLRSAGGLLSIGAQYAMVTCVKVATDEWYVVGNLIA